MVRLVAYNIFNNIIMNVINSFLQAAASGVELSEIKIYVAGHKGADPANPDQLCSQSGTEHLVRSF